jgi:hypothetical protein
MLSVKAVGKRNVNVKEKDDFSDPVLLKNEVG